MIGHVTNGKEDHTDDAPRPARADAVVFDLGGVLIDWDPRHLYRRLFEDEVAMERFLTEICTPQWHHAHDAGEQTLASCRKLARAHPEYRELIMAWAEGTEAMVAGALDESVAVLGELTARGVRCFALSNMEAETFPLRLERFEFLRWFHGHVISGFERMTKPDPRIFRLVLDRYGLDPARTVFVDDQPVNVEAGQREGMIAVLFTGADDLRAVLVDVGLLEPTS